MSGTLGVATGVGIAQEVWRTGALGAVVYSLTIGVLSTGSPTTGVLTSVVLSVTLLGWSTLIVTLTLVSAALQRIANVCSLASADGSVIRSNLTTNLYDSVLDSCFIQYSYLTICVSSTWSTNLFSGESSTTSERIASCTTRTSADGDMVLDSTV